MRWLRLVLVLGILLAFPATRAEGQAQAPPDRPDPSVAPRLGSGAAPIAAPAAPVLATDDGPAGLHRPCNRSLVGLGRWWELRSGAPGQLLSTHRAGRDGPHLRAESAHAELRLGRRRGGRAGAGAHRRLLSARPAPAPVTAATPQAPPDAGSAEWVANFRSADLWSDSDGGRSFGTARQWSYFALTGQAETNGGRLQPSHSKLCLG